MRPLQIFLPIALLVAQQIFANESCTPVDLRPRVGPVRDQDSIGWCYAFVAADLLSFKTGKIISATDVAISYNQDIVKDLARLAGVSEASFQGGDTGEAVKKAIWRGLCLESKAPSKYNDGSLILANIASIDVLKKKINVGRTASSTGCKSDHDLVSKMFPNVTLSEYVEILEMSNQASFIERLANKSCEPRIKIGPLKIVHDTAYLPSNRSLLLDKLDHELSNNNLVAIGYHKAILYTDIEDPFAKSLKYLLGMAPGHASSVVARRFNSKTKSCEYLIRNSSGRKCGGYYKSFECDEGRVWVPRKVLEAGIVDIDYIARE